MEKEEESDALLKKKKKRKIHFKAFNVSGQQKKEVSDLLPLETENEFEGFGKPKKKESVLSFSSLMDHQ